MAGGTPLGNMVIKLGLDDADFGKGVDNSKKQIKYLAKEMQANGKIYDMAGNKLGKLGSKYESLSKIVEAQKDQVKSLEAAYAGSFDHGKATKSTVDFATKLQEANGKLAAYQTQLGNTAGAYAELEMKTTGTTGAIYSASEKMVESGNRMKSVGEGFSNVGSALTKGLTVPITAGVTAVTAAAISWESAFAGVKKTSGEVVDSNGRVTYSYTDLENGLRQLATQLPATHTEIAGVAEAAGQLGIATPDIVSFTKTMIDMGESTNLTAEEAATSIAKIANITGMTADEYQKFGSSVVALGNNFATTERDVLEMSNRLAASGTLAGMTNQEILGLATAMSSVGIEAEAGGTAMTQTLTAIEQAAAQGGEKLEQFAKIANMSSEQFAQTWRDKPVDALQAFIKGLGELDSQGESATLVLDEMGLSGVRQSNMLKSLALASGTMTDAIGLSNEAWNENTALTNEAGTRYETTESKLKMLKNEAVNAAIDLGGPFVDALRSGIEASKPMIKALGDLAKKFSEMTPEQQQNIVKWVALTAAAGPALKLLGSGISTVGGLTKGIGGLGKSFVELIANQAKSAASASAMGTALSTSSGAVASLGSAAVSASGASGIGALTGALGGMLPVLGAVAGVVGVGGAIYLGWKAFGEEAWNSSQRVKQWGVDVGAAADSVLDKTQQTTGQFNLMAQGFDTDKNAMANSFTELGSTIEENLVKKISTIDELMKKLPESVKGSLEGILQEEKEQAEKSLAIVQENNEKIKGLRENAANEHRDITINEAQMIKNLNAESSEAYINTLKISKEEKKNILSAMTGDVEEATKEQAVTWAKSLGKQRQEALNSYEQQKKDYIDYLKDNNYSKDAIKEQEKIWDDARKTTTAGIDSQIAAIVEKFPELKEEMLVFTGQMATGAELTASQMKKANEQYLDGLDNMSKKIKESSDKNAKELGMMADSSSDMAEKWNDIVLDDKTGKVKTNAVEEVTKAMTSEKDWSQMVFAAKEANLQSNAKMVLAEAGIANGHWDTLPFKEKKALVESNAAFTIMQAAEADGTWKELSFEQKKALLYSDTPEKVAQAVSDMGLWDKLSPTVKELKANNFDFFNKLNQSEEMMNHWNTLDPALKELIVDNGLSNEALASSSQLLDTYNRLPADIKKLLADTYGLDESVYNAQEKIVGWNSLPVLSKQLTGDSSSIQSAAQLGEQVLNQYGANNPALKALLGDSTSTQDAAAVGEAVLNAYASNNPALKLLLGDSSNVQSASATGGKSLDIFSANNPANKILSATDNASSPAYDATNAVQSFANQPSFISKTLETVNKVVNWVVDKFTNNEKGTAFHPGGLAMVNDQKGSMYRELVVEPNGRAYIPQGRNVLLDLQRGSKVFTARQTKQMIPQYVGGVGNDIISTNITNNLSSNLGLEAKLDTLISLLSTFSTNAVDQLEIIADKDSQPLPNTRQIDQNLQAYASEREFGRRGR